MKKMFGIMLVIFILYFCMQIAFVYFGSGDFTTYKLTSEGKEFTIKEKYTLNSEDKDNYELSILTGKSNFNIILYEDMRKATQIVENIKYYSDSNYECILPIYKGKVIINDVLCNNGKYTSEYHSISNPSEELKQFVDDLSNFGYRENVFADNKGDTFVQNNVTSYYNHTMNGHFVGIVTDGVLYRINNIETLSATYIKNIGNSPVYFSESKASYLSADSKTVYYYSITSSKNNVISFADSINMKYLGSYGESLYIYDRNEKKEYEVNFTNNKLLEVGNNSTSIKYYDNGKWKHSKLENINIETLNFGSDYTNDYNNPAYAKIDKRGKSSGYYYLFKKNGSKYDVYKASINDKENLTFIFQSDNLNIKYVGKYIYYLDDGNLKYYSEKTGNKTLASINSNTNIYFHVYIDKLKEEV